MNDIEILRACAEAMGIGKNRTPGGSYYIVGDDENFLYDPLYDDAQAMALVKRFKLFISFSRGKWTISSGVGGHDKTGAQHLDLNRAICLCVAKMYKEKS